MASRLIQLCRFGGAAVLALDLVEFALGRAVPEPFAQTAEFRELGVAVSDIIMWHNDINSTAKEINGADPVNTVLAYQVENGCDLQAAVNGMSEILKTRVEQADQIMGSLRAQCTAHGFDSETAAHVAQYLDAAGAYAQGIPNGYRETLRYDPDRRYEQM